MQVHADGQTLTVDRPRLQPAAVGLIGTLLIFYALAYLDRQIVSLLVDPIRADLGVSDLQISFLQGLGFVLFYTVCGLPLGWMVDRYPRRRIIFWGIITWCLFSVLSGLAQNYTQLLAARFGVGAGEAALLPAAYSMISDAVHRKQVSGALAVFSLGAIVGGSLSLALGGGLAGWAEALGGATLPVIGHVMPWQLVFIVVGLAGFPLAFLIFLVKDPPRGGSGVAVPSAPGSMSAHARRHWRFYVAHAAGFSLLGMMMAANAAWSPTFLRRTYEWNIANVGSILGAIHLVGGALGMLGGGFLAGLLYRRGTRDAHLRLYVWAMPIIALAGVAAFQSGNQWLSLAGIAVVAVFGPFIAVAAAALQLSTPPQGRGIASSSFLFVYNLVGFGLGPTVVALLSQQLFAGPEGNIGSALQLTFLVFAPLSALCLTTGFAPMRNAVAEMEAISTKAPS